MALALFLPSRVEQYVLLHQKAPEQTGNVVDGKAGKEALETIWVHHGQSLWPCHPVAKGPWPRHLDLGVGMRQRHRHQAVQALHRVLHEQIEQWVLMLGRRIAVVGPSGECPEARHG